MRGALIKNTARIILSIVKTSGGAAKTFFPDEFLGALVRGALVRDGRYTIVHGDIDLRRHPLGEEVVELPDIVINGSLFADASCALKVCRCQVTGDARLDGSGIVEFSPSTDSDQSVDGVFSAKGCRSLVRVAGRFGRDVHLDESGIGELNWDFFCKGNLSVTGCRNLRRLDCSAWSILADGSSLEDIGPYTMVENLSVEGCGRLEEANYIPGLKWARYDGSGVKRVSEHFRCDGKATFLRCRSLSKFSGEIRSAEIGMAPLEKVDGLRAKEVTFSDCPSIPEKMTRTKVGAMKFLRCNIKGVPEGVGNCTHLDISGCKHFSALPNGWRGDIKLRRLPSLHGFPDKYRCQGSLSITECGELAHLTGEIGGDVTIRRGCRLLTELGEDLLVGGNLRLEDGAEILKLDCNVRKDVFARNSKLRETGGGFSSGGEADFRDCTELLAVKGRVHRNTTVDGSGVESIGADFECLGSLSARRTRKLESLNCTVAGDVTVEASSLKRTGPAFHCSGHLIIGDCKNISSLAGVVHGRIRLNGDWITKTGASLTGSFDPSASEVERNAIPNPTDKDKGLIRAKSWVGGSPRPRSKPRDFL